MTLQKNILPGKKGIVKITNGKAEPNTNEAKKNQQILMTSISFEAEENERKRISETLHNSVAQMLYAIKLNVQRLKDTSDPALNQINKLVDETISEIRNISFELAPSILKDFGLSTTIYEMAERLSGPNLLVEVELEELHPSIEINAALHLFRITQELVNNSIKHGAASRIQIRLFRKGKDINIVVSDNGRGFEVESALKTTSGTGMSSIRNRLSLYHGVMDIKSIPDKGTVTSIKIKT